MKNKIFIVLFQLIVLNTFSQSPNKCGVLAPVEDIFLQIDREKYIVGETLWFKAYCIEDSKLSSKFSSVLYLELFDDEGNRFIKKKYKILNGISFGDVLIPKELRTGNYFLRAYTKYQRNFPVNYLFTRVVSILNPNVINDEQINAELIDAKGTVEDNIMNKRKLIKIELETNKDIFNRRELVKLKVLKNSKKLDLSISVRSVGSRHDSIIINRALDKNPWLVKSSSFCYPQLSNLLSFSGEKNIYDQINDIKYLPDYRNLMISGVVLDHNSKIPVSNIECISAVVGQKPQVHICETKDNGRFIFTLNGLKEENMLFVGVPDNKEPYDILVDNDFEIRFPKLNKIPLLFGDKINGDFEDIFANFQIGKNINIDDKSGVYELVNEKFPSFNLKNADLSVDVKNYIELPTIEDVFRELVPGVFVVGGVGNRHFNVFNKKRKELYRNPIVLLDNIPVFDIERLMLLNAKSIDSIEVYYSKYYLGDEFFNGIISLKSSTDNFASFKWRDNSIFVSFNGISLPHVFKMPDYSLSMSINTIPDFRTTLYWNPLVDLSEEREYTFYTSDYCSKYEIIVKGFDENGIGYYGTYQIEVTD